MFSDSQALDIFTQNAIDAAGEYSSLLGIHYIFIGGNFFFKPVLRSILFILGFGKFNLKVSLLSALIYTNSAISWTSTGFILPAAACDFQMDTVDKGRITVAFMLGGRI